MMRDDNPEDSRGLLGTAVKERVLTLKPNEAKPLGLGTFSYKEPDPEYEVTTQPNIGEYLGFSQEKLSLGNGRYLLMCQLHNFGDKACEVTIRLKPKVKG